MHIRKNTSGLSDYFTQTNLYKDASFNGVFDVSELVHNITYTTSLAGQPGKLTFQLERDPNGILKIEIGDLVQFWCDEVPTFYGYVFTMGTDRSEIYQITAYDQMRYLQNHDFFIMEDMTVADLFRKICNSNKIKYQILGKALTDTHKLEKHYFADKSYFDMLNFAINESNTNQIKQTIDTSTVQNKYTVKTGDTLSSISLMFGKPIEYLMSINNIENADLIYAGQILYLSSNTPKVSVAEKTASGTNNYFRYFIRDEFGKLTLNDIENNVDHRRTGIMSNTTDIEYKANGVYYKYDPSSPPELEPLIIGDESLLTDYKYELDIDKNTFNEIILIDENDSSKDKTNVDAVMAKQSEDTIKKWGLLRRIKKVNLKNESDPTRRKMKLEDYAKLCLLEGATISKSLKLEALGFNGVNAGDGFLLELKKLGIRQMMYVISATHNYDADKHTMTLDVCTPSNLREVL